MAISASADSISGPVFEGTLRTSTKGIEMLKALEGFIERPWHDVSQYSIGYGCSTTYANKSPSPVITSPLSTAANSPITL